MGVGSAPLRYRLLMRARLRMRKRQGPDELLFLRPPGRVWEKTLCCLGRAGASVLPCRSGPLHAGKALSTLFHGMENFEASKKSLSHS